MNEALLENLNTDGTVKGNYEVTSWTPIGNETNQYTGTFDGNGKTISGLYFNDTNTSYVGLFGNVGEGGKVQNVGVVSSYFNGAECVGGVCGWNSGGTITSCYNTGSVTGNNNVGGVCGNNFGTITSCYNTGSVTGDISVGGVCGHNFDGTITSCYNTGEVSGDGYYVGGVCGQNYGGEITGCYNTGSVSGYTYVGGVCGQNYGGEITGCYNTGSVSGYTYVGGVCGQNEGTITSCYYLTGTSAGGIAGSDISGSAESKSPYEFNNGKVCYLLNGSKSEVGLAWGQTIGTDSFPTLGGKVVFYSADDTYTNVCTGHEYSNGFCGKCGGYEEPNLEADYYQIKNAGQLYWFAGLVNGDKDVCDYNETKNPDGTKQNTAACAKLTDNIVVNENVLDSNGKLNSGTFKSWTPIGYYVSNEDNAKYTGTFDGNEKTISGLYFNDTEAKLVGLFGYIVEGGEVRNVGVVNSYFNGGERVGGVCGEKNGGGSITSCYNTGSVTGNNTVGGVCGYNSGEITSCYNTGEVSSDGDHVGGVCGYNVDGTIANCYSTASVTGNDDVGGVCGYNDYGTIANCYNTGSVTGNNYVGGVCGEHAGEITSCYNKGEVNGDGDYVGGVCGYNDYGTIANCYSTAAVTGNNYVCGVCGYNDYGTIANCYYDSSKYTRNPIGLNDGTAENVKDKTTKQFKSGEVAYLLSQGCTIKDEYDEEITYDGSIWGQTIETEEYPVFNGAKVYATVGCVTYTNEESLNGSTKNHLYNTDTGICYDCGRYEEPNKDSSDVYQISKSSELYWFAEAVNSGNTSINAVLTKDITVNTGVLKADGSLNSEKVNDLTHWTPIGDSDNKYKGIFDGQGYTVSGLYLNDSAAEYVGLFGRNNGTIKNVGVVDSYFNCDNSVGGVCGKNVGIITNCYNTATVSGGGYYVGGVCGKNAETVANCYNTGSVKGDHDVGGVCGYNDYGTIANCYNTGSVSGEYSVGGVCGKNIYGKIANCYNTGSVSGDTNVGGVSGKNIDGKIANCYYLNSTETDDFDGTTYKIEAQFTSGEVAYLLSPGCTIDDKTYDGSIWGQTIGTDNYPILNGKRVIFSGGNYVNAINYSSKSVNLDGTIGFNVSVSAEEGFEWEAKLGEKELTYSEIDENGLYKFTCTVAPKDIDTAFSVTGGEKISLSDCLKDLAKNGKNDKTKALANAMLTYGECAKAYFKGFTATTAAPDVTADLSDCAFTKGTIPDGISYYGSSVIMGSSLAIRHYFVLDEGRDISKFRFTVGGKEALVGKAKATDEIGTSKDDCYYIEIPDINANELEINYAVNIDENTAISKYSVLSYVKSVLENAASSDNAKNLVKALYNYYDKLKAYKADNE